MSEIIRTLSPFLILPLLPKKWIYFNIIIMQFEHFVNEDILYPKYFALTAKKSLRHQGRRLFVLMPSYGRNCFLAPMSVILKVGQTAWEEVAVLT